MKLWHCKDSRSLRPLWALEEMGLEYEIEILPFPPRVHCREYLKINPLGTVPFFQDGNCSMTESVAICHYLAETCKQSRFIVETGHPEYGDYLNWLYHADATLTFPQAIVFRYSELEPEERRLPQAAEDYRIWYLARLRRLNQHIVEREFLCDNRFTIADIAVGFALYFGEYLGIDSDYDPQTREYLERLKARPAFQRAVSIEG